MKTLIFLLLGCSLGFGQGFTPRNVPWMGKVATPVVAGGGGGNGLLTGLAAVWEMEAADNANQPDAFSSHTLTRHGTTTKDLSLHIEGSWSCHPGTGAYLDNADSALNPASSFTVAFWIYPTDLNGQYLCANWDTAKGWLFYSPASTGPIRCYTQKSGGGLIHADSAVTITLNKWHFVAGGYDAANNVNWISVDGETKATTANTDGITASGSGLTIFDQPGGIAGHVTANLDETVYWSRVLTQTDITTIINGYNFSTQSGSPLFYSGGAWAN